MSSPLADLIQCGESRRTNYNAYNRGTYIGRMGVNTSVGVQGR